MFRHTERLNERLCQQEHTIFAMVLEQERRSEEGQSPRLASGASTTSFMLSAFSAEQEGPEVQQHGKVGASKQARREFAGAEEEVA